MVARTQALNAKLFSNFADAKTLVSILINATNTNLSQCYQNSFLAPATNQLSPYSILHTPYRTYANLS